MKTEENKKTEPIPGRETPDIKGMVKVLHPDVKKMIRAELLGKKTASKKAKTVKKSSAKKPVAKKPKRS